MNYQLSYLVYSLLFLAVWVILFLVRKDLRRRMLLFSLVAAPMGPVSEIWFLRDYWQRPTVTGYPISIEDALFAFSVGGIAFNLYKVVFSVTVVRGRTQISRRWLLLVFPLTVLSSMLLLTNWLGVNSIFASSFAFVAFAALVWILRPDLIVPSVTTGILMLCLFLMIYQIMRVVFPGVLQNWCTGCNPSGVRFLGVNVEELLWDFSWGLVGGIIYEAVRGRALRKTDDKQGLAYSSFEEFSEELNTSHRFAQVSQFGCFMTGTLGSILSVRLIRELTYRLSRITGRRISAEWTMVSLAALPPVIDLILRLLGAHSSGITFAWLLESALLDYCLVKFPQFAWSKLIGISDTIDHMLTTARERDELTIWMEQRLDLKTQLLLSMFGGCLGILVSIVFAPFLSAKMRFGFAFYVSVFITAVLGINAVHWLWKIPFMVRRLYRFPRLRVVWSCPANTRAIRALSRLLGLSALLAAVGLMLFISPVLWAYFSVQASGALASAIEASAFLASVGTVLFIAVFPQYWLSAIVYREKHRILDQLDQDIHSDIRTSDRPGEGTWPELEAKVNIYNLIDETPVLTVDLQTVGGYALALLTTTIPYVVERLL